MVDVSGRHNLARRDGWVYCRRCGYYREEDGGSWRRVRMRNGVTVVQFICRACGNGREKALLSLEQRQALKALYRR